MNVRAPPSRGVEGKRESAAEPLAVVEAGGI